MASIIQLGMQRGVDTIDQSKEEISITEPWLMVLDGPSSIGDAYALIQTSLNAFGFPSLGDSYPTSGLVGLVCVERPIEHHESQRDKFVITVKYSNAKDDVEGDTGGDDDGDGDNPLNARTVYSFTPVDNVKVVSKDTKTNELIAYSNGRAVIPPFTENFPLTRVAVTRNESNFNNSYISRFQGRINSGSMTIDGRSYSKGTVQFENVSSSTRYTAEGAKYYSVTYSVLINVAGFVRKFIEADNYHLKNGKLVKNKDGSVRKLTKGGDLATAAQEIDGSFFVEGKANTLKTANLGALRL